MASRGSRWLGWLGAPLLCTLVVACHHQQPAAPAPAAPTPPVVVRTTPPPPPPRVSPSPPPKVDMPAEPTEEEIFARTSLADLNAKEPLDDTFFAYDRVDLTDQDRAALQRNAVWMKKWSRTHVLIEGHADERGTNEYNLALGERRAAETRNYLVSLGIDPARLNIVSKGEEAPFCTADNEGCWHLNRRGHFIITAK